MHNHNFFVFNFDVILIRFLISFAINMNLEDHTCNVDLQFYH